VNVMPCSEECAGRADRHRGWVGNQGRGELTPLCLATRENTEIFYFPCMIKFANSEFILVIRGPKLAKRGVQCRLIKHKIVGFSLHLHP